MPSIQRLKIMAQIHTNYFPCKKTMFTMLVWFLLNKKVQRCMFRKKKIKMYTSHSLFSLKSGWRQSIRDSISCAFWWKGRRLPLAVMDDGVWQISPTINKTTSFCIEVALYFPFIFFQTIETRNELTPILLTEKIFIFKIKEENQIISFQWFFFSRYQIYFTILSKEFIYAFYIELE